MFKAIFVLCCILSMVLSEGNDWWRNTNRLHNDLLVKKDYTPFTNPQPVSNHTTDVFVSISLRAIFIDDFTQILTLNAWVVMLWTDHRLKWNEDEYGGLSNTEFGASQVWRPDLMVYNSAEPTNLEHFGMTPVMVYSNGEVFWVPPATVKVECPMDLTYWPFDTQTCVIVFGSWTKHGFQIDFHAVKRNITDYVSEVIKTSHHWEVTHFTMVRTSVKYACCDEPYISIDCSITMKRGSPSFTFTVIIPAVAVALLTLVQFCMPLDYPPRVTIGAASALIGVMMLISLFVALPPLGSTCPLIVKYYGTTLLLTVISIALSGVLARLAQEPPEVLTIPPPVIIKTLLTGPLATVLFLRAHADKVGLSGGILKENDEEVLGDKKSYQHEWLLVAATVDRLTAVTYVVVFVLCLFVFTSPLH